jgi:hypothetical protein
MIKTFLILISFWAFLFGSEQIVLVVADDYDTSKAKLECFEDEKRICKNIDVNIGKNGLGWGLGEEILPQKDSNILKFEGDKKAPIGIFKLSLVFGYSKSNNLQMPYIYASEKLICVDDSNSKNYNKIISLDIEKPKSFEYMKREDAQYELGVVVEHNKDGIAQRGSCIFMHVQKAKDEGTAGCTAMELSDLEKIVSWLDAQKNPILIQIPKSSAKDVLKLYPKLKSSELLH